MINRFKISLSIFILLLSANMLSGQCTISNLQVEVGDCIEANYYSFTLNFNISESPGDNFDVYLNGEYYNSYPLNELPVTINEYSGSASGVDTLLVCASETEDCCAEKLIENPCTCDYYNLETNVISCTEDSMKFNLDFDYFNVSDSFMIGSPLGFLGTFHINELPLQNLAVPRMDSINVLIQDQNSSFCFNGFTVYGESCDQCSISNVLAIPTECNDDNVFYVTLSFEHMNTSESGFTIVGSGVNYGSFLYEDNILLDNGSYMDSLILGPIPGDCETVWEFVVYDNSVDQCHDFTYIEPICCEEPCEIWELGMDGMECVTGETVSFWLNFNVANPGNGLFHVFSGETYVGIYEIGSLPVFIESFPFNGETSLLRVCINDQEDCCAVLEFENPYCENEDCSITELVVDGIECTSEETIQFYLNFNVTNPGNDLFEIWAGGQYFANYPINELPILIENFPLIGEHPYMRICINDQENCCKEYSFNDINCNDIGCEMSAIDPTIFYITTDSFYVQLDFEYSNPASNHFTVQGNGINYGTFDYDDVPIILGPYACQDSIFLEYVVRDIENGDCQTVLELGVIPCLVNTSKTTFASLSIHNSNEQIIIEDEAYEIHNGSGILYNVYGQKIMNFGLNNGQKEYRVQLPYLVSGIYIVHLFSGSKSYSKTIYINR
jgi:hypothetical protein